MSSRPNPDEAPDELEIDRSIPTAEDTQKDSVDTITIVGGGDAGLITALTLREFNPDVDIIVVDDFEETIPEVGKSTISYILNTFHSVLGIERSRFVSEVKPIWKASVYFKDWCGRGPFHVPFDDFSLPPTEPGARRFEELYYRYENEEYRTLDVELAERGKSPFTLNGNMTRYEHVAYHLSTNRLNEFLRDVCAERGIELVDDEITAVETESNGIKRIEGDTTEYESDLYIDASGFERVLMGELENDFTPFDFPLDSALVAKADIPLSDIVPATVVNSGDHGWFWQIDTYDWRDMGYVYSSEYVSEDEAITEFIAERDEDISKSEIQQYSFDAGTYEKAWVNNCIAVGNALGFVEPLQSTALTLNAILTEKLSELLADHYRINHRGVRNIYNDYSRNLWNNVYNFVSAHYRYSSGENEFWNAMQSVNDGDGLDRYVDNYRDSGFNSYTEFGGAGGLQRSVFDQWSFYRLLRSLGVESEFYETVDIDASPDVKEHVEQRNEEIAERAEGHFTHAELYEDFM